MPNDEKYLLNFGGREIDSRDFVQRAQGKVLMWIEHQGLKGDERQDFLDTFNQTLQNIVDGTWTVSDYGRINGLEYRENQEYNKYGRRLKPGEKSWKGRVKFDPAYSVETYLNGIAGVSDRLSPEDGGKVTWKNDSAGRAILDSIFGKGNVTDDATTNSTQLANWADEVGDRFNGTSRSTQGRVDFLKNVLRNYLQDIQNDKYDISNNDKEEEINKINKILADGNVSKFELGTLGLSSLLFDREKFLTEQQIADMQAKSAEDAKKQNLNDFLSGQIHENPFDKSDPNHDAAQRQHDEAVKAQEQKEIEYEFDNLPESSQMYLRAKNLTTSTQLPNFEMNFSNAQFWALWESLLLNNKYCKGTDLDKMTKVQGHENYLNPDNYVSVAQMHFANYLKKYLSESNRFSKYEYVIPDFIDWDNNRLMIIKWNQIDKKIQLIEQPITGSFLNKIKNKNIELYQKLFSEYQGQRRWSMKQGGVIKLLSGGTTQPLRYWFDDTIETAFKDDNDLQDFYRKTYESFHGKSYQTNPGYYQNKTKNNVMFTYFSPEGLEAFENYLENELDEDEKIKGQQLAQVLRNSFIIGKNSGYNNGIGFVKGDTGLILNPEYQKYLKQNIDLPEGVSWDDVFSDGEFNDYKDSTGNWTPEGKRKREYWEKFNNAIGIRHLIYGLTVKPKSKPKPPGEENDEQRQKDYVRRLQEVQDKISQFRKHLGINPTDYQLSSLETYKRNLGMQSNWNTLNILNAIRNVHSSPFMVHYKQYTSKPLEDQMAKNNADFNRLGDMSASGTSDQNAGFAYRLAAQRQASNTNEPLATKQADDTRASVDKELETARQNDKFRWETGEKNRQADIALWNTKIHNLAATNKQNADIALVNIQARQKGIQERAQYEYQRDRTWSVQNDPEVVLAKDALNRLVEQKRFHAADWNAKKDENETKLKAAKYQYDQAISNATSQYDSLNIAPIGTPYGHWGSWYTGTYRYPFFFGPKFQNGGKMLLAEQEKSRRAYEKMFYNMLRRQTDHLLKDSRSAYNYYRKLMMQDFKK